MRLQRSGRRRAHSSSALPTALLRGGAPKKRARERRRGAGVGPARGAILPRGERRRPTMQKVLIALSRPARRHSRRRRPQASRRTGARRSRRSPAPSRARSRCRRSRRPTVPCRRRRSRSRAASTAAGSRRSRARSPRATSRPSPTKNALILFNSGAYQLKTPAAKAARPSPREARPISSPPSTPRTPASSRPRRGYTKNAASTSRPPGRLWAARAGSDTRLEEPHAEGHGVRSRAEPRRRERATLTVTAPVSGAVWDEILRPNHMESRVSVSLSCPRLVGYLVAGLLLSSQPLSRGVSAKPKGAQQPRQITERRVSYRSRYFKPWAENQNNSNGPVGLTTEVLSEDARYSRRQAPLPP